MQVYYVVNQLACTTTYQNMRTILPMEFFQNRPKARKKTKQTKTNLLSVSCRIVEVLVARDLWMSQAKLFFSNRAFGKVCIDGVPTISLGHLFQCCTNLVNKIFSNIYSEP